MCSPNTDYEEGSEEVTMVTPLSVTWDVHRIEIYGE
jgi:hypothetical protein